MERPIRCFSCGKVLGDKYEKIDELKEQGKSMKEIFGIMKIDRICCRLIIMNTVVLSDKVERYTKCNVGLIEI